MRKTTREIILDVESHLACSKKKYYCTAVDKATAQAVEEHFLSKGMKGETGGGTQDTIYVYCYEITNTTKE